MDHQEEELKQIVSWLSEEGLAPDSPKEAQLRLLWRALQRTRSRLSSVTLDLDTQRSQHFGEMAEVRKSLEQIRIFTEHKDVLAQEIQDENDQLKDQFRRLISLQDAQISEVAKMLYQQGLTELIHSSPSEQVAYLLVERASFLETSEVRDKLTADGKTAIPHGTEAQALNTSAHQILSSHVIPQSSHKGAPRHGQSPWKRLFGLHKASQGKHTFIPEICMEKEIQDTTPLTHLDPVHLSRSRAEARHLAGQASSVERECSRLERDLEEGSRRLAMAHSEIRRLTDELESAHLTQRAYEPELQAAQQEVEQLRQEVENLKKYEMVELRKAKELNDRLDHEIRAVRNRVRSLDAEKSSLQQKVVSLQAKVDELESVLEEQQKQTEQQPPSSGPVQAKQAEELVQVASLQKEVERLESALQELHQQTEQQLHSLKAQANQAHELAKSQTAKLTQSLQTCRHLQEELTAQTRCLMEKEGTVLTLQREVEQLVSALQEQQQQAEQQLHTVKAQASRANALAVSQATELVQREDICKDLEDKLSTQSRHLLQTEEEIHSLKAQLESSRSDLDNLIAAICPKENNVYDQKVWRQKEAGSKHCENTHCQLKNSFTPEDKVLQDKGNTQHKVFPDYHEAVKTLLGTKDKCETLKEEICETLKCLDKERSRYHEMKEKHKAKLCRARQKCDYEITWRDEKIKSLQRELSTCSHSLTKEKELTLSITVENDKLLVERRRLLQQLNEEEHHKTDSHLTASLSKCRVDFLEMENRKLGDKILHMSSQMAVLERSLQNMQALRIAEELDKRSNPTQILTTPPVKASSVKMPEPSESQGSLDNTQSKKPDVTFSPHCFMSGPLSRPAEMGYLNLTSIQSCSDHSAPPAALNSSDSTCC